MANLPVVPAGVMSLKCLITSSLFASLAFLARVRINVLVSGSGRSNELLSSCRVFVSWSTTSLASCDGDKRYSNISPGRPRAFSLFPKRKQNSEMSKHYIRFSRKKRSQQQRKTVIVKKNVWTFRKAHQLHTWSKLHIMSQNAYNIERNLHNQILRICLSKAVKLVWTKLPHCKTEW